MPIDPKWIPAGWSACTNRCDRPETASGPTGTDVWCACIDACLNEGRCGCRLVRRKKIERDEQEPDGWKLGDVEMVQKTCGTREPYDSTYYYKCLCLQRDATDEARGPQRRA